MCATLPISFSPGSDEPLMRTKTRLTVLGSWVLFISTRPIGRGISWEIAY